MRALPLLLLVASLARAEEPVAGLIVGHTTHDRVRINVRTAGPGEGTLEIVGPDGKARPVPYATTEERANRAVVDIDGLSPRAPYTLRQGGEAVGSVRTMPAPGAAAPLRIGFGSCLVPQAERAPVMRHDGREEIENHLVWKHLASQEFDAWLWIGDRFYLPGLHEQFEAAGEGEVRRTFWMLQDALFAVPGVAPFSRRTPSYVIWDDHDYGPNNASGHFAGKGIALDVLRDGFANPPMGEGGVGGCSFRITLGQIDLFLLDDRWHRECAALKRALPDGREVHSCTPDVERRPDGTWHAPKPLGAMYGEKQMAWLRDGLTASKATFKVVVGGNQMLSDIHRFEAWYQFEERGRFLAWLKEERVPGVVFVSGDRHHGEIGVLREGGPYPL